MPRELWCSRKQLSAVPGQPWIAARTRRFNAPTFETKPEFIVRSIKASHAAIAKSYQDPAPGHADHAPCPAACRSGLVHAVLDVEPAIVAGEALGLHLGAARLQLGPVGSPLGLHVLQLLHGELDLAGLGLGRCRCSG